MLFSRSLLFPRTSDRALLRLQWRSPKLALERTCAVLYIDKLRNHHQPIRNPRWSSRRKCQQRGRCYRPIATSTEPILIADKVAIARAIFDRIVIFPHAQPQPYSSIISPIWPIGAITPHKFSVFFGTSGL